MRVRRTKERVSSGIRSAGSTLPSNITDGTSMRGSHRTSWHLDLTANGLRLRNTNINLKY
jgi:hypothetical protein